MSRSPIRSLFAAAFVSCAAPAAVAQTFLSGPLSDATTGPLGAGMYVTNGAISVPAGQTLTIAAGAIVKFRIADHLTVDGTLLVNGAVGNEVIFTDYRDDSAGGDTNGNGPSSGSAGWWYGLIFQDGSDASALSNFEVRYAGYANYASVTLNLCNASFSNGLVRQGLRAGVSLNGNSYPSLNACDFQSNGGNAIDEVDVDALPGLSNNTASGNGLDTVVVSSGEVNTSATVGPHNGIDETVYFTTSLHVPAGVTLTLQAGTVLKFGVGQAVAVDGTLVCDGASSDRVIFTDLRDDSAGGDTNHDGASSGSPGWWYGLTLGDGADGSTLSNFEVRYAGYGNFPGVLLDRCDATLANGVVRHCGQHGASLSTNSHPTISACSFEANGGRAIDGVLLDALPGLSDNTATGNGFDQLRVSGASVSGPLTLSPTNGIQNSIFLDATISIPAGQVLTLRAGVVLKFQIGQWVDVQGTLITHGAAGAPVVFTDYRDDSAGGNINGDGVSSGAPGWWYGLVFASTSDASSLDYFEVRYAGYANYPGISIVDSDLTLTRGIVRNCNRAGIDLNGSAARPVIRRCAIRQNQGSAITRASMAAVPFITRNTATGNHFNHLLVTDGTVNGELYIDGNAGVNNVIVVQATLQVANGAHLTLGPGAAFKFTIGQYMNVDGALDVIGTEAQPIVFTDYRDDSVGGDSNGDGASTGAPGWWYGLIVSASATSDGVDHLLVRYAGYANFAAVTCSSSAVELEHVRAEHANRHGFELSAAARARFLSCFDCPYGFLLSSGAFDLEHATVHGAARGIRNDGTFLGSVIDSIAWGCAINYESFGVAQVRYSCGLTGGTGNFDVDPLFVAAATGDFDLQAISPCIDAGDPFSALDADGSRSDLGAYPALGANAPQTYCAGKPNSAGCTPFLAHYGFASTSSSESFLVRAFNVVNNKNGLFYYGLAGRLNLPFQGGTKCVANPVHRLALQPSGGNAGVVDCSGIYVQDFNALIQSGIDPLLVAGATVDVQCWYRDPNVPSSTGLSNGLEFHVTP